MMLLLFLLACQEKDVTLSSTELYDTYCGLCHGYEGEGYLAKAANALSNQDFLSIASDEFLIYATTVGRPETKMSAWGESENGPLSDQEIVQIVEYIRKWQSVESKDTAFSVSGDPVNGLNLYQEYCQYCHGDNGQGGSALSLNSPTFLESVDDGFLWYSLVDGRRGTTMTSYSEILTEDEIADLVSLIRSWEE